MINRVKYCNQCGNKTSIKVNVQTMYDTDTGAASSLYWARTRCPIHGQIGDTDVLTLEELNTIPRDIDLVIDKGDGARKYFYFLIVALILAIGALIVNLLRT